MPAKVAYIVQDIRRLVCERGLTVRFPSAADPDWSLSHAAFLGAQQQGAEHTFHVGGVPSFIYAGKLYWGQDRMHFLRDAVARKGLRSLFQEPARRPLDLIELDLALSRTARSKPRSPVPGGPNVHKGTLNMLSVLRSRIRRGLLGRCFRNRLCLCFQRASFAV